MLELKDLKPGDIAWFGCLKFGNRFTCLKSVYCQVKIKSITDTYVVLEDKSIDGKYIYSYSKIFIHEYGSYMSTSLYATEDELKEDWNSIILNEIDALTSYYQKRLKSIKNKIKE